MSPRSLMTTPEFQGNRWESTGRNQKGTNGPGRPPHPNARGPRAIRPGSSSAVSGGAEDGLDLELHRDLVADDHAAAVHRHLDVDAELRAGDLRLGGEAGAGAAVGVGAEAVELERQGD